MDRVRRNFEPCAGFHLNCIRLWEQKREWNVSGNLSGDYRLDEHWSTQLAPYGTRTASMEERFINHFTPGADAYEYVGNPLLRPEANHQAEWSLSRQSSARFKFSAFYSYITGLHYRRCRFYAAASICRWSNRALPGAFRISTPPRRRA